MADHVHDWNDGDRKGWGCLTCPARVDLPLYQSLSRPSGDNPLFRSEGWTNETVGEVLTAVYDGYEIHKSDPRVEAILAKSTDELKEVLA